jgi:hypothetical protein
LGNFRCGGEAETAKALIATAENWLKSRGMTRVLGPLSAVAMWDEPGVLIKGFDHPPTVMMGIPSAEYHQWIESSGYQKVRRSLHLCTCHRQGLSRTNQSHCGDGREKRDRITSAVSTRRKFDQEAAL